MTKKFSRRTENFVYHGSFRRFVIATPRRQVRSKIVKGKIKNIFDKVSFHATPYRWVALNYIGDNKKKFKLSGRSYYYATAVSLYKTVRKIVEVYGVKSLKYSLKQIFGRGGYLFSFRKKDFIRMKGLGHLELVSLNKLKPVRTERIKNVLGELVREGVKFKYIDLSLSKNEPYRLFYSTDRIGQKQIIQILLKIKTLSKIRHFK